MKFKRKIKKLFFYDKSFIKMVCLLIVLLFVLILGNSFGYVSASGNYDFQLTEDTNFSTYENYQLSEFYNSNVINTFNYTNNSDLPSINIINSLIDLPYDGYTVGTKTLNLSNSPNYIVYTNYSAQIFHILFFNDSCKVFLNGDKTCFLYSGTEEVTVYYCSVNASDFTITSTDEITTNTMGLTDSNLSNYRGINMGNSCRLLFSNVPVYSPLTSTYNGMGGPDNCYLWLKNFAEGNESGTFVDVNYQSLDGSIGNGGGGGSNEGTSENNMYLQDSKWNFSIPAWKKLTSYSGNATFSASLNDFQQENLNEFYLRFTFSIHTSQSYVDISYGGGGTSGGDHGTDVLGSGSQYTGYKNYIFKYLDSATNNQYVDVTLQDFYNMGSSKAFMTLNGIFDRCYKVGFSGNMSDTKFLDWYNEAIVSSANTTTKATLYCYATLYDSSGNSSGNCTYYYDLLNGTSGVTDSSMSVNNNPYVDEDGDISTTIPEEGTTESTYNGNGVNVTQNVTVNNDSGDSKSWLWTLISSLISSDDETVSQAGMSDTLVNFVGINPWLSLMSTTFGFIPATIWTTLSACFLVVMGILVVAFVLRIILDLL